MESLRHKLIKNTALNTIGRMWGVVLSFLLMPYIVLKLGNEAFGVWAVVGVIISYFMLTDFGVGWSFVKYISEYYAKKDYRSINQVVNTGFVFYTGVAVIILLLALGLNRLLLSLFKVSPDLMNDATFALIGSALIVALGRPFGGFGAIIIGLQRYDIRNGLDIFQSLINAAGTVAVLELGYGLKGLIINGLCLSVASIVLSVVFAYRLLPELRFNPFSFWDRTIFKKLFSYGATLQVNNLSNLINMQVGKLLLGYFLNVSVVTFYEVGTRIAHLARSGPMLLLGAIIPMASELDAKADRATLERLYMRGSKYMVIPSVPLVLFILMTAPVIISAWMGPFGYDGSIDYGVLDNFESLVVLVQLMTIGYFMHVLTGMGTSISRGMGRLKYELVALSPILIVHVALNLVLIPKMGLKGAAIGAASSFAMCSIVNIVWTFKRIIGGSFLQFLEAIYLKPFCAALLAGVSIYWMDDLFSFFSFPPGRVKYLAMLGTEGLIFFGVYFAVILWIGYIDEYDRHLVLGYWNSAKALLRKDRRRTVVEG